MKLVEILKAILFGIVEGVTEWLPVSSTGHMIILNEFLPLELSASFCELFFVVIQLGAILAVPIFFHKRLFPKEKNNNRKVTSLYLKILVGCIPAGILGLLFDDLLDKYFYNYTVVSIMLVFYGVIFLFSHRFTKNRAELSEIEDVGYGKMLLVGAFQSLSLIPGTSRSGVTILGGMLLGMSRECASELSFLLAIPIMLGASGLKVLKFFLSGLSLSGEELVILIFGFAVAFFVSIFSIRFLMDFVRRHTLMPFGFYRIVLGIILLVIFNFKM